VLCKLTTEALNRKVREEKAAKRAKKGKSCPWAATVTCSSLRSLRRFFAIKSFYRVYAILTTCGPAFHPAETRS